jgi:ADP-ribose pyrophosphatase YjhB (NUDIX family)
MAIDVMLILERDGEVLLAECSGTGYAAGWYNLPSGQAGPGEDVVAAAAREAREGIGVIVRRRHLAVVHVMQHRCPDGSTRIGYLLTASMFTGEPANSKPGKCSGLWWADLDDLPENTWPYAAAGLTLYRAGVHFSLQAFAAVDGPIPAATQHRIPRQGRIQQ